MQIMLFSPAYYAMLQCPTASPIMLREIACNAHYCAHYAPLVCDQNEYFAFSV